MKRCHVGESLEDSDSEEEEEATAPHDEGSSSSDPLGVNPEALPPWEAVNRGGRSSIWKGEAGKFYWHPKKKFKVVGVSASRGNVCCARACATCNKPTRDMNEAFCCKRACGGKRQVQHQCSFYNDGIPCTLGSNHLENGKRLCDKHWVGGDPAARGCPRCQTQPRCKSRTNGWCGACVRKDKHASVEKAQRVALEALMAAEGIAEWPGAAKATPRTRYAKLNPQNGHAPHVVVKAGSDARHACEHPNCCQMALKTPATGERLWCIQHGGGVRCCSGAHLEDAPPAEYKLSATAQTRGADGTAYARPELEGTPCCLPCLKQMDPDNKAVKIFIRKEHLVVSAVAEEFLRRGLGHLVLRATGIVTHDCASGPSQRREDLDIDTGSRMLLDFENDEHQHVDRLLSCEHKKLAGHLTDRGVVGMTKAEAALWDPPHPDDVDLETLKGTPNDTPATRQLRRDRLAVNTRLLREYAVKRRAGLGGDVRTPKLHCVRFNCDSYVAADGTRVGGLFATTGRQSATDVLKLKPTKAFKAAIVRLVDRLLELRELAKDDAWMEAHKDWQVEYLRYDGCDLRGRDADGAVAAAQAARSVVEEEGAVVDTDGEDSDDSDDSDEEEESSEQSDDSDGEAAESDGDAAESSSEEESDSSAAADSDNEEEQGE